MGTAQVPENVAPTISSVTSKASGGGTAMKAAKRRQVRILSNMGTSKQTHGVAKSMTWDRIARILVKSRLLQTSISVASQSFAQTKNSKKATARSATSRNVHSMPTHSILPLLALLLPLECRRAVSSRNAPVGQDILAIWDPSASRADPAQSGS